MPRWNRSLPRATRGAETAAARHHDVFAGRREHLTQNRPTLLRRGVGIARGAPSSAPIILGNRWATSTQASLSPANACARPASRCIEAKTWWTRYRSSRWSATLPVQSATYSSGSNRMRIKAPHGMGSALDIPAEPLISGQCPFPRLDSCYGSLSPLPTWGRVPWNSPVNVNNLGAPEASRNTSPRVAVN